MRRARRGDAVNPVPARRNPLALLAAAAAVTVAALLAADLLTPALLLGGTLLTVPLSGLGPRRFLLRTWPLLFGAAAIGCSNYLYGDISAATALGLSLRVLAMALPGVLALASVDPTELADALVQHLHAPARFAYGTLAAIRMLPLLAAEWQTIGLARRARGIDAGWNPVAAVRLFGGRVFGLLVGAIRRATRLAVAMDARGFDADHPRTHARRSVFGRVDCAVAAGGVLFAVGVTAVSVAAGSWRFLTGI
ncbi:MAG: energy-coupling factor transport system permease protein [Actinomycetota bacterium]|jgi:energy-coupling factor transport system permease protein|nr:energy-coupling factor transport system permease protein [Actinomycetota bacterium]